MTEQHQHQHHRIYTKDKPILDQFDYIVIGAGSGGMSTARSAAQYGAKVALVEQWRLGGTCVNAGCVPKKLQWYAANIGHSLHDAEAFGFDRLVKDNFQYNWKSMKKNRDAHLSRLNGVYYRNALKDGITIIRGCAQFDMDEENDEPDLSSLTITHTNCDQIDDSTNYFDGFNPNDYSGKEVFVDEGFPIKIKLIKTEPGSYEGSKAVSTPNTEPLSTNTNFLTCAPGGNPVKIYFEEGGHQYVSTSSDFFKWERQPRRVCVVGGGYIGVELCGVMDSLGTDVTFVIRENTVLPRFDHSLTEVLMSQIEKRYTMVKNSEIHKVTKLTEEEITNRVAHGAAPMEPSEIKQLFSPMHVFTDFDPLPQSIYAVWSQTEDPDTKEKTTDFVGYFDTILSAVGRTPPTHVLNVPTSIVDKRGHIKIDEMGAICDDKFKNIFGVGDVLGKLDLTPVAVNFGRRLSDWLFGGKGKDPLVFQDRKTDSGLAIPSVIFSHPPLATCGLSSKEAEDVYSKDKVRFWSARFVPMYCALLPEKDKSKAFIKMITTREFCTYTQQEEDIIIGIHMIFSGAEEAMQGFAIAVANRLPKSFLDNTVAIHPTASEELVLTDK